MENKVPLWRSVIIPILLVIIFIVALWGVISLQASTEKPSLTISLPNSSSTNQSTISINGKTAPSADLTINGHKITVDINGNYSDQIRLNPGQNTFTFKAKQDNSKTTTITRTVTRVMPVVQAPQPAVPTPTTNKNLAATGPTENIGIVGLVGILLSLYLYLKTRKRTNKTYRIFTG